MSVGFDGTAFRVLTTDGRLPWLTPDAEGIETYQATTLVASSSDRDALRALLSIVTTRPALGMVGGGIAVIEAGPGPRTLTIPTSAGGEASYSAALTAYSATASMQRDSAWRLDLTWLILAAL